jgi:hypothetical protein
MKRFHCRIDFVRPFYWPVTDFSTSEFEEAINRTPKSLLSAAVVVVGRGFENTAQFGSPVTYCSQATTVIGIRVSINSSAYRSTAYSAPVTTLLEV